MELQELHVLERQAGAVGHRHAVAGDRLGVGREAVERAAAAGRDEQRLAAQHHRLAARRVDAEQAGEAAVLDEDVGDEELVVAREASCSAAAGRTASASRRSRSCRPPASRAGRSGRRTGAARCGRARRASRGCPSGRAARISSGIALTKRRTTSWSARKSEPLTVSQACRSSESPSSVRSTAAVPPSAHTEWARISCTFETMPMSTRPSSRDEISTAARSPARPAPRMRTSWVRLWAIGTSMARGAVGSSRGRADSNGRGRGEGKGRGTETYGSRDTETQRQRRRRGRTVATKLMPIFRQSGGSAAAMPCRGAKRRKPWQGCAERRCAGDFQQTFPQKLWKARCRFTVNFWVWAEARGRPKRTKDDSPQRRTERRGPTR